MTGTTTPPAGPRREPPPVTVTGGRAAGPSDVVEPEPPGRRTGPWLAGLAAGLVLLAAVASADRAAPPPPPVLSLALTPVADELTGSQGGVLVVPVAVQGSVEGVGVDVAVTRTTVWAEPVRQQPSTTGRTLFAADRGGRLRVLLQPDCRLLVPDSGIVFAATLAVDVTGPGGRPASAVLDLAGEPALAARISALCRPGDGLRAPAEPDGAAAAQPKDDGAAVGCPGGLCTGARDAVRG